MRKLTFTLFFSLLAVLAIAQTTVSGTLVDAETNEPLIGASIIESGTSNGTITDLDGTFQLEVANDATLTVSYIGYTTTQISINGNADLGNVLIAPSSVGLEEVVVTGVMDIVRDRRTPVAVSTIGIAEIQAKSTGNVEFPEVMKNTPNVYVSNQTGFGDSQMFLRGFDQTNTAFLLNGQPINGMEDGRMYWSNWSGMSDVANAVQVQRGLGSSKLAISSVGGTVNIVMKSTDAEEGGSVRFLTGNDQYYKGTVAYNSGLKGKWAYSLLLDHWQGERKYGEGTKGQGQNYFFAVGYKPSDQHTFNFLITGAPQWHGQQWSQKEEKLKENPKFNQHWGFDGEVWTTERRNFYHKPVINLSWDFDISETSSLASVLYASFGRGGGSGPYGRKRVRTSAGQVDFTAIRANNLSDSDGIGSFGGNYALRGSMNNHQWFGNVTNFTQDISENLAFSVGADFRFYTGDHFRQLLNLYGLKGWQDSFRNSSRGSDYVVNKTFSYNPWSILTNYAKPSERIAYDYSESINYQGVFGQLEYKQPSYSAFVQTSVSNQSYQREGRWADVGKSKKVSKVGYNVKGGASFNLDNNNIVFVNAGHYSRQPFLDNIFENIRYSNDLIQPDVENEKITGYEAGYKYGQGDFQANVNLYHTTWGNRTIVSAFNNENGTPDDESDDFTQRNVERGIAQVHKGLELDASYRIEKLKLRGHLTAGNWEYKSIESTTAYNDDTGALLGTSAGDKIAGVKVTNAPQFTIGLGANYKITNGLSAYLDYNFFDKNYRRARNFDASAVVRADAGSLPSYGIFDFGVSYRLPIEDNFLTFRGNIYNLMDKFYINQTDPYGSLIGNGRTWNASVKYSF